MNNVRKIIRKNKTITLLETEILMSPAATVLLNEVKEILRELGSDDQELAVITTFVVVALSQKRKGKEENKG